MKRSVPGASPNKAINLPGLRWSSVPRSPNDIAPISSSFINASSAFRGGGKANIALARASGCAATKRNPMREDTSHTECFSQQFRILPPIFFQLPLARENCPKKNCCLFCNQLVIEIVIKNELET
jgi:hypothetical protein